MVRNVLLMISTLSLVLLYITGAQAKSSDRTEQVGELDRIALFAGALEKQKMQIDGWSVYAREQEQSLDNLAEFRQKVQMKRQKLTDYSWHELEKKEGSFSWEATKKLGSSGANARVQFIAYPAKNQLQFSVLFQVEAASFATSEWEKNKEQISREMRQIFHGEEQIFSCVRAYQSDKMRLGLLKEGEGFLKEFSAAPIEQLDEKTFVSISAYTKAWNDDVFSGKHKMNIQVALRSDGDRTAITLGTPIITAEY
ncbi:hypothetical protein EWI07_03685 [Sporolactobacillus sp. THM7-4]|nr:hypothetical protein EWI07_03685 [Sporolactobacillus sp. THM7-4]